MTATSAASTLRRSVGIEEEEDADAHSRNVSPVNASRIVESSDGNDNNEGGRRAARALSVINVNDDSSDEELVAKETDEAERGRIPSYESIGKYVNATQIALQKNGTHPFTHSSTLSHQLTMLETLLDVFMSSSATRRHVGAKG
jgi:hypothetical protein